MALTLQPVTQTDIPSLSELWYKSFSIPINLLMFPDTPNIRNWWNEANSNDLLRNPRRKYLKIVDPAGTAVAYAKWDLDPQHSGARFPAWHAESDSETCNLVFTKLDEEKKLYFGTRKFYYLDMLVVHPEYRGRGAASMLIQWGCELADREGVPVYLDAHVDAASLYRRFGFKDREDKSVTPEGAISMIREPVK
ncbi:hypothetical protein N7520_001198 [Penicillium odoratum]|uniref:uncharacterized protein n=1 Tax=Penicillium odoratum TaxID=1167516 RepID=UPI0025468265|nr:uncharacterized protein N7520_001198 [Penicillium odoratum]KAJ5777952.1 hypothetical protein N7520_001198 [Penicillium odoratum]